MRNYLYLFLFLSLIGTAAAAKVSSSEANKRLEEIDKEMAKIQSQIDAGANPEFFKKYIEKFNAEKAQLSNQLGAQLQKPTKRFKSSKQKTKEIVKIKSKSKTTSKKQVSLEQADKSLERYSELQSLIHRKQNRLHLLTNGKQPWRSVKPQVWLLQDELILLQRESDELGEKLGALRVIAPRVLYTRQQRGFASTSETVDKTSTEFKSEQLKYYGQARFRHSSINKTPYGKNKKIHEFRLRGKFEYQVNDKVEIAITPQVAKTLGGDTDSTGLSSQQPIDFYEAYTSYKFANWFSVHVGRQELSYGDELIIGSAQWTNEARSFDSLRGVFKHGEGQTDVFVSQIYNNDNTASTIDNGNLRGIYSQLGSLGFAEVFDVYFLHYDDPENVREVNTIGFRIKGKVHSFYYGLEAGDQKGVKVGDDAHQGDIELGYKSKSIKLGVGCAIAGDSYHQMFPTEHSFLGYTDLFGRRNIQSARLRFSAKLTDKMKLKLDIHNFQRLESDVYPYKVDGISQHKNKASSKETDLGSELDLGVSYKFFDSSKLSVGASYFQPGQFFKDQGSDYEKEMQYFYLQVLTKF